MIALSTLSPHFTVVVLISAMTVLFVLILGGSLLGRRRAGAEVGHGAGREPGRSGRRAAPAPAPVDRRSFLRGGMLAAVGVFVAQMGGASLAFLWPNLKGGFGSLVQAGSVSDIKASIAQSDQPFYSGAGRFWVVPYTGDGVDTIYAGLTQQGLMALYQKCPHLGCRVPFCQSSRWFECPCHGSKYNEAGEYQLGPAPTGMFRFKLTIQGDTVMVDTSNIIPGPPRGTNTIHEPPEGPFCV
jgi:cytochrome b6-f complex iron-sulfur subunit